MQSGHVTELQCSVVLKCLSNEPDKRYQTCDELLNLIAPQVQKDSATDCGQENRITAVTREAIFDYLIDRHENETTMYMLLCPVTSQAPEKIFDYSGRKNDLVFLSRLYDLEHLPSKKLASFKEEIIKHTIQNSDFEYGWVFGDDRLQLNRGSDEILLKFLAEMFHPVIRSEESDWEGVKNDINNLLRVDGYEIYESEKISGRSVYSYRYCL